MERAAGARSASRRRWGTAGALVATCLLAAACSGDDSGGGDSSGARSASSSADGTEGSSSAAATTVAPGAVTDGMRWTRVPMGAGGFVTGLVATGAPDGRMYARTDVAGAYRWDAATETWSQLLDVDAVPADGRASSDYSVASLAVAPSDPDVVYLAVGDDANPGDDGEVPRTGSVLASTDGGATFRRSSQRWFVSGNQGFRTGTERLAVDPRDPSHVVFGTQRDGLWSSSDGGATWSQVPFDAVPAGANGDDPRLDQAGVGFVAFGPTGEDGGPAPIIAGVAGLGIVGSDDGGTSWRVVHEVADDLVPMGGDRAGDDVIVALWDVDGVDSLLGRWSFDDASWTDLSVPVQSASWVLGVDPADPERLVLTDDAVRDGHLWTSSNGGEDWEAHDVSIASPQIPWLARTDLDDYMSAGELVVDPTVPGRVWFAEGMGVWRTDDVDADEVRWETRSQGIEELVVANLVVPPGGASYVTVADRQGFRLDDLVSYPAAPLVDERFASGTSIDWSAGDPQVLAWVGAESNIFWSDDRVARGARSVDAGRTWQEFGGLEPAMLGGEVAVSATDPDVLVWLPTHYVSPWEYQVEPAGVYVSRDGGRSWEHQEQVGGTDAFHRFFWWLQRRALAADRVNGDFALMSDDGRFFVSSDDGATWDESPHAPDCTEAVACHVFGQLQAEPGAARTYWASTGSGGLFRTTDAGATAWQRIGGVDEARAFSFGAPAAGSSVPTVFLVGRVDGAADIGLWTSTDGGDTWELLTVHPGGSYADLVSVAGDPEVPGRVLVAAGATGLWMGEPVGEPGDG